MPGMLQRVPTGLGLGQEPLHRPVRAMRLMHNDPPRRPTTIAAHDDLFQVRRLERRLRQIAGDDVEAFGKNVERLGSRLTGRIQLVATIE